MVAFLNCCLAFVEISELLKQPIDFKPTAIKYNCWLHRTYSILKQLLPLRLMGFTVIELFSAVRDIIIQRGDDDISLL